MRGRLLPLTLALLLLTGCASSGDLAETELIRVVGLSKTPSGLLLSAAGEKEVHEVEAESLAAAMEALVRLPYCDEANLSHTAQFLISPEAELPTLLDYVARSRDFRLKTEVYIVHAVDPAQVFREADDLPHRVATLARESGNQRYGRAVTAGEAIVSLVRKGYALLSAVNLEEGILLPAGYWLFDREKPLELWGEEASSGAALVLNRVKERVLVLPGCTLRLRALRASLRGHTLTLTGEAELLNAAPDYPGEAATLQAARAQLRRELEAALEAEKRLGADVLALAELALRQEPPEVETVAVRLTLDCTGDVAEVARG